jgi:RimJ/RimL family protein N-acetyltransferase
MTAQLETTPVLGTERLTLRVPRTSGFEVFAAFVTSARARCIGGGADKDIGQAWRVLAALCGHWHLRGFGTYFAGEKATGRPIGSMGPWFPANWPERERGWTIWNEADEGRGVAFEAVTALCRLVYRDPGWDTAVSYIDTRNARSRARTRGLGCRPDFNASSPFRDEPVEVWRHPAPQEAA